MGPAAPVTAHPPAEGLPPPPPSEDKSARPLGERISRAPSLQERLSGHVHVDDRPPPPGPRLEERLARPPTAPLLQTLEERLSKPGTLRPPPLPPVLEDRASRAPPARPADDREREREQL